MIRKRILLGKCRKGVKVAFSLDKRNRPSDEQVIYKSLSSNNFEFGLLECPRVYFVWMWEGTPLCLFAMRVPLTTNDIVTVSRKILENRGRYFILLRASRFLSNKAFLRPNKTTFVPDCGGLNIFPMELFRRNL